MEIHECEEFISDMCIDSRERVLLATSGDGTLSAYDIRHHKLKVKSETFDSEFLSCAIVKVFVSVFLTYLLRDISFSSLE